MTESFNALATYLHDVFVIKFDGCEALGLLVYIRNPYFIIVNGRQSSASD
jgi:hypothetical protein